LLLGRKREVFPDTRFAVLYHPALIETQPLEQICQDFEKICSEAAPVDLALVDIEGNASDERVKEVVQMAYEIEKRMKR